MKALNKITLDWYKKTRGDRKRLSQDTKIIVTVQLEVFMPREKIG